MPGSSDRYRLGRAVVTAALTDPALIDEVIEDSTDEERKYAIGYLTAALVAIWETILPDPVAAWQHLLMEDALYQLEEEEDGD